MCNKELLSSPEFPRKQLEARISAADYLQVQLQESESEAHGCETEWEQFKIMITTFLTLSQ